jgi:hypothetical protein
VAAGFGITMEVKHLFFDRQAVTSRVAKANRKALSKAGAFVRRSSRSSIRRRKRVSRPGEPPSAHSTDPVASIKNILFAYEPANEGVVIGPVRLHAKQVAGGAIASGTVPQTLELGGTVGLREKRVGKRWVSAGRRKARPGQPTRVRKARYAPRPFMGPALAREAPKFPDLWSNSVRA